MKKTRRTFIRQSSQMALGLGLFGLSACTDNEKANANQETKGAEESQNPSSGSLFFEISLAQWSLHKTIFDGKLDNLGFAAKARNDFGIGAVEYVNQFFADKAEDQAYLTEMNKRASDNGVKNLLIMIDREGGLGELDDKKRLEAIENHYKWVEAAKFLGCHSIRVNAYGEGTAEEVSKAAVDGLGRLAEYAAKSEINVIVENHGGHSSNGEWLSGVMKQINLPNCGTLPDFGNFCIKRSEAEKWEDRVCLEDYDRYKGVTELMPYAKAVSAKANDFSPAGDEVNIDYMKLMKIVKEAGYKGYVGIEYEGSKLSEDAGIMATKLLLEKVGKALG